MADAQTARLPRRAGAARRHAPPPQDDLQQSRRWPAQLSPDAAPSPPPPGTSLSTKSKGPFAATSSRFRAGIWAPASACTAFRRRGARAPRPRRCSPWARGGSSSCLQRRRRASRSCGTPGEGKRRRQRRRARGRRQLAPRLLQRTRAGWAARSRSRCRRGWRWAQVLAGTHFRAGCGEPQQWGKHHGPPSASPLFPQPVTKEATATANRKTAATTVAMRETERHQILSPSSFHSRARSCCRCTRRAGAGQ